jgi:hypothetical protein
VIVIVIVVTVRGRMLGAHRMDPMR